MTKHLKPNHNVVRYAGSSHLPNGQVTGSAFRPKPSGKDLSVNWLECFENQDKKQRLNSIRCLFRRTPGANGKFAELNVGRTIQHFNNEVKAHNAQYPNKPPIPCDIQFVNTPLPRHGQHAPDPSHCDIFTLPPPNPIHLDIIGDFIAESVTHLHPAQPEKTSPLLD